MCEERKRLVMALESALRGLNAASVEQDARPGGNGDTGEGAAPSALQTWRIFMDALLLHDEVHGCAAGEDERE